MSVDQESVVRPVLDDSVRHLYIPRQEIDRYQRLARGEVPSEVESFRSASVGVAIDPGVRAHMVAYRLSSTLGSPPVFVVVPMVVLAKVVLVLLEHLDKRFYGRRIYSQPVYELPPKVTTDREPLLLSYLYYSGSLLGPQIRAPRQLLGARSRSRAVQRTQAPRAPRAKRAGAYSARPR